MRRLAVILCTICGLGAFAAAQAPTCAAALTLAQQTHYFQQEFARHAGPISFSDVAISAASLLAAHRTGYLPERGGVWEHPPQRGVSPLNALSIPKSLRRRMRQMLRDFPQMRITLNGAVETVIQRCADTPRISEPWMTAEIIAGYQELARHGIATSLELWDGERLVAGAFSLVTGAHIQGISKFRDTSHPLADGAGNVLDWAEKFYFAARGIELIDVEVAAIKGTDREKQDVTPMDMPTFLNWQRASAQRDVDLFPGAVPSRPLPIVESAFLEPYRAHPSEQPLPSP